jgi:hypothetical protein
MDFERYRAVIFVSLPNDAFHRSPNDTDLKAVGLLPDLEILDDADLTEIGER